MSEASEHLEAWDITDYEPPYSVNTTQHNIEQNTPEWLELRKGKITASNAHILLKNGRNAAISANNKESGGGFYADRGHILEDEALEIYEGITGIKPAKIGFITNDKYNDCGYSPDADHIEIKCFKEEKHLTSMDGLPLEVYTQVQFGMMIAEWDYIDVLLYNPDIEDNKLCFKIVRVDRDEKIIERFRAKL
jgi:hypothetical protein